MDFPLILDLNRLLREGPLIKYEKEENARIGLILHYGDANSIKWFGVENNFTFHIFNSFEDGDEVVLWGCRALEAVFPEPKKGWSKFMFPHFYEWRLNMQNGKVKERRLCGEQHAMDFLMINAQFTGVRNRFGYAHAQVVDRTVTSIAGKFKYGGIAKLYFEEAMRVEYQMFEKNVYCTGAAFVHKDGDLEEDDGWVITFVHNEDTDMSQVHIIDAHKFSEKASAIITMPRRVPYGFHGASFRLNEILPLRGSLMPKRRNKKAYKLDVMWRISFLFNYMWLERYGLAWPYSESISPWFKTIDLSID